MTKNGKVENIVAKGEIACFEQFVFKKPSAAEGSESVYMRERVNVFRLSTHVKRTLNPFPHTTTLQQTTLKTYPKRIGNSL